MSLAARSPRERSIPVLWRAVGLALSVLFLASALACGGNGSSNSPGPGGSTAKAPAITAQPQDQTVSVGQTATFTVVATGTMPLSYQWKKNGTAIANATSSSYTTPVTTTNDSGATFTVTVSNSAGHADSRSATLTVNDAPSITTQPQNQSVVVGQTATFSVMAAGATPLSYQWKKNGTAISGATLSSYTTPATTNADNGATFSVTVTNGTGTVDSDSAVLTVTAAAVAPSITTQPQNASVASGATATFSVVATGTAPLSYQWKKNGTAISGATSSTYTTSATTSTDNGATFLVTVTNGAGHVDSDSATLTVTAAPTMAYLYAYSSNPANGTTGLVNKFIESKWGSPATNLSATAPGRTGQVALEVTFGAGDGWTAAGLARRESDWSASYPLFLNQFRTIEFDIQFASNSTGEDNLEFIFQDAGHGTAPKITSLITGWSSMTTAQKHGNWFHVSVDIASLQPDIDSFEQFLLFNGTNSGTGAMPHYYLADVKLGWVADSTPPVIGFGSATLNATYDTLTLAFTTDEPTTYKVDYGTSTSYGHAVQGDTTDGDYVKSYSVDLTGLTPGTTCYYRITAKDHQFQSSTTQNQSVYTGSYVIPVKPTTPPVISNLTVTKTDGCSATLAWSTDRPCTASVSYHKSGGATMTRSLSDLAASRTFLLDLLQPSTAYSVTVTATDAFNNVSSPQTITANTTSGGTPDVTITIDPSTTTTISPYIYGLNFSDGITDAPAGVTMDRQGGNRWTAYNWENNASNAGSDWYYHNDDYLGGGDIPAGAVLTQITSDQSRSQASLMTVQLQGYVAADKLGTSTDSNQGDLATRFKKVVDKKGSTFTTSPSTSDASVYMDEFIWNLDHSKAGIFGASAAIPTFISLDNEPELWNSTHSEIQGTTAVTSDDYITKTINLTEALKDQFPDAKLFGPVHFGFSGLYSWTGDVSATNDGNDWFVDKYLLAMKAASTTYGKRLVDVYDFHWYSEAYSEDTNKRVSGLTGATLTDGEVQAVVQSPRSLWDTTYSENSWISVDMGLGPIYILGRLQDKIDADYPGTKIAITEYESGGDNHIAGSIAQADNLGIFADKGVFAASWWPPDSTYPYTVGAFRAYRGFDGANANFGDTSLKTTSSSIANVSVHASLDSQTEGRVVFVAINRSISYQEVALNGQALSGTATVYRITAESGAAQVAAGTPVAPVLAGSVPVSGNSFLIVLPPMSVSTIEVK